MSGFGLIPSDFSPPLSKAAFSHTRSSTQRSPSPHECSSALNPFRTAVSLWGQTTQISRSLSPKRDCGSKRVKLRRRRNVVETWYYYYNNCCWCCWCCYHYSPLLCLLPRPTGTAPMTMTTLNPRPAPLKRPKRPCETITLRQHERKDGYELPN